MLIDWFTTGAQLFNFLVLLWALNRFLFKPIIRAVDEREDLIRKRLLEAEEIQKAADQAKSALGQRLTEIESERSKIIKDAEAEASELRKRLMAQVNKEVQDVRSHRAEQLALHDEALQKEISDNLGRTLEKALERALYQLSGENTSRMLVAGFLDHLSRMKETDLEAFLSTPQTPIIVRAGHKLSPQDCEMATLRLREHLGASRVFEFFTDQRLGAGIEFASCDRSLAWNFREYLRQLSSFVASEVTGHNGK